MESIFDTDQKNDILRRIRLLEKDMKPVWGKMNAFQMLRHCTLCEEMMQGETKIKRVFIGRLLGRMVLKKALAPSQPFKRNSPTSPLLKTTDAVGDFSLQRDQWMQRIENYSEFKNFDFVHPFFGKMTTEQIGTFVYKHADHHLRQFGV